MLEYFEQGASPYLAQAESLFGRPCTKADEFEYYMGKKLVLGAGYQMGAGTFRSSCAKEGVVVTHEFAEQAIGSYRAKSRCIEKAWYGLQRAAETAINNPGRVVQFRHVSFRSSARWLQMRLPSGRLLSYYKPRIDEDSAIRYWGTDQVTGDWSEQYLYGGKLMQHIGEGIARDIMRDAIIRLEGTHYDYRVSIHDEVIAECDEGTEDLDEFSRILIEHGADYLDGLPLKVSGWTGLRYFKG